MNRVSIPLLGALLVIQVLLAVALSMSGRDFGAYQTEERLLPVDTAKVNGLFIQDSEQRSVTLQRKEGKWALPDIGDFPAEHDRTQALIDKLTGFTKGWPVATTQEAAERFKVTDDNFERKIQLKDGDTPLVTLYLGTSPGFRKIHARVAGDKNIYAIEMGTYEAQATVASWENKDFLKLTSDHLKQVDIAGMTVQWDGEKPALADLKEGEVLDETKANDLIHAVLTVPFQSVLGKTQPEAMGDKPVFSFKLTLKSGNERVYDFYKPKEGDGHILKVSEFPFYFKVSDFTFEELKGYNRESLLKSADEEKTEGAATETQIEKAGDSN